ncbi:MAG: twitching motility protein PilT, partial [Ignavibacteriales bacterium]
MKKGTITFFVLISILVGTWVAFMTQRVLGTNTMTFGLIGLGMSAVSYVFCRRALQLVSLGWNSFNILMDRTSVEVLLGSIIGGLLGTVVGFVLGNPFEDISGGGEYISFMAFFFCGFLGLTIGRKKAYDFISLFQPKSKDPTVTIFSSNEKVLDTSAIIDGRIYDVALSGFLEGRMVVPGFVIEELRHIADSSDYIRRSKGRRGLEILSKMQKHPSIPIGLFEGDFPEE